MPMYEYKCADCQTQFEELVQTQSQIIICPECKSEKVEKLLSVFSASVPSSSSTPCGTKTCSSGFS